MKRLFILLVLLSIHTFAQSLSISYNIEVKPDKNNKKLVENELCVLDIDEGKASFYYSPIANATPEMMDKIALSRSLQKQVKSGTMSSFIIKKELEKDKMVHYFKLEDDIIAYEDDAKIDWKIENETKNILDYICRKATGEFRGRKYTAYYVEGIPISEGPYKFKGLPGLVLEVSSEDGDYTFTAVSLEKVKKITSPKLKAPVMVKSRNHFIEEMKSLAKEPSKYQRLRDQAGGFKYETRIMGRKVTDEEKYQFFNKMIWNFMKNHNNPIETDDIWIR